MTVRSAEVVWHGDFKTGEGHIHLESGEMEADYNGATRFDANFGTNPEELIGAAHAACFSMALTHKLATNGYKASEIRTKDKVHLERSGNNYQITRIDVNTEATIPGIDEATFLKFAEETKDTCPVSKALAGTEIILHATLHH